MEKKRPPTPEFRAGDFVKFRGHDAMVDSVSDSGNGYNLFRITRLKDGEKLTTGAVTLTMVVDMEYEFSQEFEQMPAIELLEDPNADMAEELSENLPPEEEIQQCPESVTRERFPVLSEDEIQQLVSKRLSEATKRQTKHHVKLFRGK